MRLEYIDTSDWEKLSDYEYIDDEGTVYNVGTCEHCEEKYVKRGGQQSYCSKACSNYHTRRHEKHVRRKRTLESIVSSLEKIKTFRGFSRIVTKVGASGKHFTNLDGEVILAFYGHQNQYLTSLAFVTSFENGSKYTATHHPIASLKDVLIVRNNT
jgi:hypothetical protein